MENGKRFLQPITPLDGTARNSDRRIDEWEISARWHRLRGVPVAANVQPITGAWNNCIISVEAPPTRLDEVAAAAKVHQPAPYFLSLVVHSASNSAFPSIRSRSLLRTPAEIMLPEISIKRGRIRLEPALDWICRVIVLEDGKKKLFGRKNGWLGDSKATYVRCPYPHTPLFKIPPSFSFLNLSPFALVILPVSLFTGKPPTNTRIEILPFPSRRDFLTYYFLEKLVPGDGLSESWSTKFM